MKDNKNTIFFAKVRETAIIPTRRDEDGCLDLYANFEEDEIVIQPHQIKLIPTGIASAFDKKYRIAFRERGSNTKSKLVVMAGQIDSGYRNEWFVALYNTQHIPVSISKEVKDYEYHENIIKTPYGKAICQFAIEDVPGVEQGEIPYDDLINIKSERMFGMLGDSGK